MPRTRRAAPHGPPSPSPPNPRASGLPMNRHTRTRFYRELDAYLAFWTEARPSAATTTWRRDGFNYEGPRCRRCGTATEWPVERCSCCIGVA